MADRPKTYAYKNTSDSPLEVPSVLMLVDDEPADDGTEAGWHTEAVRAEPGDTVEALAPLADVRADADGKEQVHPLVGWEPVNASAATRAARRAAHQAADAADEPQEA